MSLETVYYGSQQVDCGDFDCGEEDLNTFIREEAKDYPSKGLAAIVLLVESETRKLAGFFAISPTSFQTRKLTQAQKNFFNVPYASIPAWLIGRLAISREFQQQGLGSMMLLAAIDNIRSRARNGAGALIMIEAKNEQVQHFYEKFKFEAMPDQPRSKSTITMLQGICDDYFPA